VTLITRKARIKRMELNVFSNVRSSGLLAMSLDADDSLDWARMTNGEQEFMVVTRHGKALRFHEQSVRPMGRSAAGVMAMRLLNGDEVVSLDVVQPDGELLVIHEQGWGKRTPLDEFNAKGRYTQGNWATDHRRLDEVGPIVAARVVHPRDQITVMTSNGLALRTAVSGISRMGRSTRGVRVVKMQPGDTVAALAVLTHEDLTRGVDGGVEDDAATLPGGGAGFESAVGGELAELDDEPLDSEMLEGEPLEDGDGMYLDELVLDEPEVETQEPN